MFLCDSAVRCGVRGEMKLLDVYVIVLVSVFYLSRLPSPLRSLKADLIAKKSPDNIVSCLSTRGQLSGMRLSRCSTFTSWRKSP